MNHRQPQQSQPQPQTAQSSDGPGTRTMQLTLTDTNEEIGSEYSEAISVISFSDTDDELKEIEQKVYPPGDSGKEQAYKDIETVFHELENEQLLDPFSTWKPKPKEEPAQTKKQKNPKFVPKRPSALPRKTILSPSPSPQTFKHQYQSPSHTILKSPGPGQSSKPRIIGTATTTTATITSFSSVALNRYQNANAKKPLRATLSDVKRLGNKEEPVSPKVSPCKSLMVELMMEATQEQQALKKKEAEAEALAKLELEKAKRSKMESRGDMWHDADDRDRPRTADTASSMITTFDDEDVDKYAMRTATADTSKDYLELEGRQKRQPSIASSHPPPSHNFQETKQNLVKDPYTRKAQLEVRKGVQALRNISPLVTCGNEDELRVAQVKTKPTATYRTHHESQRQHQHTHKPAAPSDSHISRQEQLILELAQGKDSKKQRSPLLPEHQTATPASDSSITSKSKRKGEHKEDKTTFKITYKEPTWPHQVTLDKMVDRLYRVKMLLLDDSQLKCLRDISSLLPSLIVLSVKNCGLKTLDGTLAFPNLQKLLASDNLLTHPSQCSLLSELQELDLSGNPIETLDGFDFLGVLNFLRVIKLYDTKVCELKSFHLDLRKRVPSLRDIFPKTKTLSCDLDFDDDDNLFDEDFKLFGKTVEELEREQDNGMLKTFHGTHLIPSTVTTTTATATATTTPTDISSSLSTSTRNLLGLSTSTPTPISAQTPDTAEKGDVDVDGHGHGHGKEKLGGKAKGEARKAGSVSKSVDSCGDSGREDANVDEFELKSYLTNNNLTHIYHYFNEHKESCDGDSDDNMSLSLSNFNDDHDHDHDHDLDLASIEGNSSLWSSLRTSEAGDEVVQVLGPGPGPGQPEPHQKEKDSDSNKTRTRTRTKHQ